MAFPRDENAYLQLTLKLDGTPAPASRRRARRRRLSRAWRRWRARALAPRVRPSWSVRAAQERGPAPTSAAEIRAAIDQLGDLDYATRVKAGAPGSPQRRRASGAGAAAGDPASTRTASSASAASCCSPASTIRARPIRCAKRWPRRTIGCAKWRYGYFELHPDRALIPRFLAALDKENGDFVRPALVRALAAVGDDPKVRDALLLDVTRGVDFFRSTRHRGARRLQARAMPSPKLIEIAKLDGPLQDDAVMALGKIGRQAGAGGAGGVCSARGAKDLQPTLAAAICLLGVNCSLASRLPGEGAGVRRRQSRLSGAGARRPPPAWQPSRSAGNAEALEILFDKGIPSMDPIRAPLALAVAQGGAAQHAAACSRSSSKRTDQAGRHRSARRRLRHARGGSRGRAVLRRGAAGYWAAPDGSPTRKR